MGNHFHLLLRVPEREKFLLKFVKESNSRVAGSTTSIHISRCSSRCSRNDRSPPVPSTWSKAKKRKRCHSFWIAIQGVVGVWKFQLSAGGRLNTGRPKLMNKKSAHVFDTEADRLAIISHDKVAHTMLFRQDFGTSVGGGVLAGVTAQRDGRVAQSFRINRGREEQFKTTRFCSHFLNGKSDMYARHAAGWKRTCRGGRGFKSSCQTTTVSPSIFALCQVPLPGLVLKFRIPMIQGALYNLDHADHAPPPVSPRLKLRSAIIQSDICARSTKDSRQGGSDWNKACARCGQTRNDARPE